MKQTQIPMVKNSSLPVRAKPCAGAVLGAEASCLLALEGDPPEELVRFVGVAPTGPGLSLVAWSAAIFLDRSSICWKDGIGEAWSGITFESPTKKWERLEIGAGRLRDVVQLNSVLVWPGDAERAHLRVTNGFERQGPSRRGAITGDTL